MVKTKDKFFRINEIHSTIIIKKNSDKKNYFKTIH